MRPNRKSVSWTSLFLIASVVTQGLAAGAAPAFAGTIHPVRIPEVGAGSEFDPESARPSAASLARPFVPASADGGYQMLPIGGKFAAVFDPAGEPVAIFDLSLNHLSWKDIALGGIGFGDLHLARLIKLIRKARKDAKRSDDVDADASAVVSDDDDGDAPDAGEPVTDPEKAKRRAMEAFEGLRFTREWAIRNHVPTRPDEQGVPFQLASFTFADLQFPSAEMKTKAMEPFRKLAEVLYPEETWTDAQLASFAAEFEFRYDDRKPGYEVRWNRSARMSKKGPALPGVVVNYLNPWQNLVYKYNLRSIQSWGELLIRYLGPYGIVLDLLISRVCWNLTERLDYHENQLIGMLEAAERFEYKTAFPPELTDVTIDLLYLNKFTSSKDESLTDGMAKRKRARAAQEVAREKALKALAKTASKKQLELVEFGNSKFALARSAAAADAGAFRGIYGLAVKPLWPFNWTTMHVNAKGAGWKVAERYGWDAAGFAARVLIPNNIGFRIWKIAINARIDPDTKDLFVQSRMINETNREGELTGLLDEASAGRYSLPMSAEEIASSRRMLRQTYVNPYKLGLDEEPDAIARNLKLLKDALAGGASRSLVGERLVPFVM